MFEQLGLGIDDGDVLPFKKSSKRRKKRIEFSKGNGAFDFYGLSSLVVGKFNEKPLKSIVDLLESRLSTSLSLFIHGKRGVGKTRLIFCAVGEYLRKNPYVECKYFSGKDFIEERNAACEVERKGEFLEESRSVDVLIVDDIDGLSSQPEIVSDLLYVIEGISRKRGKVIFSSSLPLSALMQNSANLVNSMTSFITQKVDCFDAASSRQIFEQKTSELGISLDREIIDSLLYKNIQTSVDIDRLIREIFRIKISESLDALNLEALVKYGVIPKITEGDGEIDLLIRDFATKFDVDLRDILSRSRKAQIAIDRHIVMHYLNVVKNISLNRIAGHFGRDHTVALYAVRRVGGELQSMESGKFFSRISEYKKFISQQ